MYDYTRGGNPTRTALEKCLSACEDTKHGKDDDIIINLIIIMHV